MPILNWRTKTSERAQCALTKSITTLGSNPENDIYIADLDLVPHHAQVVFDGKEFTVVALEGTISVNGKKKKRAKLVHEDNLVAGAATLYFDMLAPRELSENDPERSLGIDSLKRLQSFSAKLMEHGDVNETLELLLDEVIAVSDAAKGFLLLFEGDTPKITVSRNLHKESLTGTVAELSDSIIAHVIETKAPLIVSDAIHDTAFARAQSVINLQLSSVMCVPLLDRGQLIGLIYVGNDSITGLFDKDALEVLTVFAAQASLLVHNALLLDELKGQNKELAEQLEEKKFGKILGSSDAMQSVFRSVEKVARADVSVLICGDTGTGKELIAGEIHRRSPRSDGPFVSVNCGAIPETLMESEFFGHVKGAFTGAVSTRDGKFQTAQNGTLFLDEIGEMPLSLQVKLLRVLQEREVVKVGASKSETLNIRVVAATNRNLEEEVKAGRFREDLLYRLNVVQIDLPPLKDRQEDVLLLANFLANRYAEEFSASFKGFTPGAASAMRRYGWPGNVRELENKLKKAVILTSGAYISEDDLDLAERSADSILTLADARENFQQEYIKKVLEYNGGNRTKTAKDLDVDPRTIFRYLEKE